MPDCAESAVDGDSPSQWPTASLRYRQQVRQKFSSQVGLAEPLAKDLHIKFNFYLEWEGSVLQFAEKFLPAAIWETKTVTQAFHWFKAAQWNNAQHLNSNYTI